MSSSPGSPSSPDQTSGVSVPAPPCPDGTVEFRLDADPGGEFYAQQAYPLCSTLNWLKLYDTTANEQHLVFPGNATDCSTCAPTIWSQICTTTSAAPTGTITWTWNGRRFEPGTCGGGAGASCIASDCAPPGNYIASMCGSASDAPDSARRCINVPFTYPAAAAVVGQLPPASGPN